MTEGKHIYLYWAMAFFFIACHKDSPPPVSAQWEGRIEAIPDTIVAGEAVNVPLHWDPNMGERPCLVITNSLGEIINCPEATGGSAMVEISSEITSVSGWTTLSLLSAQGLMASRHIKISSRAAEGRLLSFHSPKRMAADKKTKTSTVFIPQDRYLNLAEDGTEILVRLDEPNGDINQKTLYTRNSISVLQLDFDHTMGKILIGGSTKQSNSSEKEITIDPGTPASLILDANESKSYADGRQQTVLNALNIRDRYDQKVDDGTLVRFLIRDKDETTGLLNAISFDGTAQVPMTNPFEPGRVVVQANIANTGIDNQLVLDFQAVINDVPVHFDSKQNKVLIGPVSGHLGQLLGDGFPVQVLVSTPDTQWREAIQIIQGKAEFSVEALRRTLNAKEIRIRVGGLEKSIRL